MLQLKNLDGLSALACLLYLPIQHGAYAASAIAALDSWMPLASNWVKASGSMVLRRHSSLPSTLPRPQIGVDAVQLC